MPLPNLPMRGRGAADNPTNRFETISYGEAELPPESSPRTQFLRDTSRSIITYNDSPDVGFSASINPYRGCEHGCAYCYARPTHEYLGFSAGLDFETKILVKEDAPELLRKELKSAKWQPQVLGLSGVTDAYQPIERKLELTRRCLQALAEFRNPVVVITKNHLVTRDADHLAELARFDAAAVLISLTTLSPVLRTKMEPRASHPDGRLSAVKELSAAGVPVGVMIAPVIPGLNDHEIPTLLNAAAKAGARMASFTMLRLPLAVGPLFEQWLEQHYPEHKDKVLGRIRDMHGGKLNDSRFGVRMRGEGVMADAISQIFKAACRKAGIPKGGPQLSSAAFRRSAIEQGGLFD